jgi:hypothetical protein
VVVFVIGGMTRSELRAAYEVSKATGAWDTRRVRVRVRVRVFVIGGMTRSELRAAYEVSKATGA